MESWLPWLCTDEHLLTDVVPDTGQVLLVEPVRMRDRAGDILAEEDDLARSLAVTWGAVAPGTAELNPFPRLHLPFDRLLAHTQVPVWTTTATPAGPDTTVVSTSAWDVAPGDPTPVMNQVRRLLAEGYRIVVGADSSASASGSPGCSPTTNWNWWSTPRARAPVGSGPR